MAEAATTKAVEVTVVPNTSAARPRTTAAHRVQEARAQKRRLAFCSIHDIDECWFFILLISCLFCLVWIVVTSFSPKPVGLLTRHDNNGTIWWGICPPRGTVCAEEWYTLLLLAISRGSAYATYPLMMLLFLSKTNHLRTLLQSSYLSLYIPFYDLHAIHTYAGKVVSIAVGLHGTAHITRWLLQGNGRFLVQHQTGVSGLISFLLTPLITLPLAVPYLKKRMSWEWRKGLHYLSIVWGVSICFHAPTQLISYLIGVPVCMYLSDYLIGSLLRTYRIDSSAFSRLENGVELTFEHPPWFTTDGTGYVLVCLPWISKFEWHAFSLFSHPTKPNHSCVCMAVGGDWTKKLHESVERPTRRPAWISGPFASPYATAVEYDNLILVASGIGITPAMSIVTTYKATRRVNLIWACRDASLLEFYLDKCSFDRQGWTCIYYTGKRKLRLPHALQANVLVFNGRPELQRTIREMIIGVENGLGLPEDLLHDAEEVEQSMLAQDDGRFDHEMLSDAYHNLPVPERFSSLMHRSLASFGEGKLYERATEHFGVRTNHHRLLHVDEPMEAAEVHLAIERFFAPVIEEGTSAFDKAEEMELYQFLFAAAGEVEGGDGGNDGKCSLSLLMKVCKQEMDNAMILGKGVSPRRTTIKSPPRLGSMKQTSTAEDLHGRATHNFREQSKGRKRTSDQPPVEEGAGAVGASSASTMRRSSFAEADGPDAFVEAVGAHRLVTWQMLYCGGSRPVVAALEGVEKEYGIRLRVEKFDW